MKVPLREKIGLAVLIAAWMIWGSDFIADRLVSADQTGVEELRIATAEHGGDEAEQAAEPEPVDFMTALARADATEGAKVFRQCKACHSVEEGGKHKVGPNLYDVVANDIASAEGFSYSDALSGVGGTWDYEHLNQFLQGPSDYAPGTKMTFRGISDTQDRANVIAYLAEHDPSPPAMPEAPPEEEQVAEAETAGSEGDAMDEAGDTAEKAMDEAAEAAGDAAESAQQMAEGGGSQLASLLESAEASEGQKVFRKCQACHTVDKGGPNRVGPNLYGVVGREKATVEGFNYSDALASLGGTWTYEELAAYLEKPNEFAPGNRMAFPGVRKAEDRAAVIKFLREHDDDPEPLP